MNESLNVQTAVASLKRSIHDADRLFGDWMSSGDQWYNPAWEIEGCFLSLLAIAEAAGLTELRRMILSQYSDHKKFKKPFLEDDMTPDGDPYSASLSTIRKFLGSIEQFFPSEMPKTVSVSVLQVLRDIHYSITDNAAFGHAPNDEGDVHARIEAVLKPVFPDLKHKPVLTKPIKNFEPDTGIPSIRTLIEYKFLSRAEDAPVIADQVLADTRGYYSGEWTNFIYVIYETKRFENEKDRNQLLRQSGVPENTTAVVLSGEPPLRRTKKKRRVS